MMSQYTNGMLLARATKAATRAGEYVAEVARYAGRESWRMAGYYYGLAHQQAEWAQYDIAMYTRDVRGCQEPVYVDGEGYLCDSE